NEVKDAIGKNRLARVVVACCSPRMHENTFRRCIEEADLNPYLIEIANIREHCSWVHPDNKEEATKKAIELIKASVAKVIKNEPLFPRYVPLTKRVLIIGGGIAGIQSALDTASAGYETILLEREPSIGGRMAQLDKTFPTLDCSACILTPKMVDIAQNKNIKLLTYSELEEVSGFIGNFNVKIRKKARYVNEEKCTGCGVCYTKCPKKLASEFDLGIGIRKAIYVPFPQAVPNIPVIDKENCIYFIKGKCKVCEKFCPANAIDFEQEDVLIEEKVGAIIVATGFDTFDPTVFQEYGYGRYKDVITSLQFERLINASGPTGGEVKRPSDGKHPKRVAFIQCVGSRDDTVGRPYCSKVCCMYTAKHTILLKEHEPDSKSYVFYIDIRAPGKGYEEFVRRAQEEYGATYIRGKVAKIYERGGKLVLKAEDTLIGKQVEIEVDLVVLAVGIEPKKDAKDLARKLNISYDTYGFYNEAHPKLRPVETLTDGIYLAGVCQGVKDIPDAVAQGSAAAAKVCGLFSSDELITDPLTSVVDKDLCVGCCACISACPFNAIEEEVLEERTGERIVAKVNETLCKGCGVCVATCPSKAVSLKGWTDEQVLREVEILVGSRK
ncbi:MAG: disulfide reductase, partial [Armatimonadetes bacterium CG07_land_8_20_14_0_80_40_9]